MSGPVDDYLAAVERGLRGVSRRTRKRFLAEARAHLLDRVDSLERSGVRREEAARQAVTSFGPPHVVADRVRSEDAGYELVLAPLVTLACALLFVLPFYAIPENVLPPAPWPSAAAMPDEYAWKYSAMFVAFATAVVAALLSACAGILVRFSGTRSRRRSVIVLAPAAICAAGLLAATALSSWLDVEWAQEVPGTPAGLLLGVALPLKLALALTSAAALALAARRAQLLSLTP
jgi:HAAS